MSDAAGTARVLAELARLRERLERVEAGHDKIGVDYANLIPGIEQLVAEVKRVQSGSGGDPAGVHWPDLAATGRRDDLATALEEWVGEVLARSRRTHDELTGCWRDHPDAVDALTAAWQAWEDAYRHSTDRAAMARYRAQFLGALRADLHAELSGCRQATRPCVMTTKARLASVKS